MHLNERNLNFCKNYGSTEAGNYFETSLLTNCCRDESQEVVEKFSFVCSMKTFQIGFICLFECCEIQVAEINTKNFSFHFISLMFISVYFHLINKKIALPFYIITSRACTIATTNA